MNFAIVNCLLHPPRCGLSPKPSRLGFFLWVIRNLWANSLRCHWAVCYDFQKCLIKFDAKSLKRL